MAEREKFGAQAEEQLKHLRERLDSAKTKAEAKGDTFLRHFEEDLARIESKYDLARYKLKLLRSGSGRGLPRTQGRLREGLPRREGRPGQGQGQVLGLKSAPPLPAPETPSGR